MRPVPPKAPENQFAKYQEQMNIINNMQLSLHTKADIDEGDRFLDSMEKAMGAFPSAEDTQNSLDKQFDAEALRSSSLKKDFQALQKQVQEHRADSSSTALIQIAEDTASDLERLPPKLAARRFFGVFNPWFWFMLSWYWLMLFWAPYMMMWNRYVGAFTWASPWASWMMFAWYNPWFWAWMYYYWMYQVPSYYMGYGGVTPTPASYGETAMYAAQPYAAQPSPGFPMLSYYSWNPWLA